MTLIISKCGFTQGVSNLDHKDSFDKLIRRHAIVIEGLGKTWGSTLNYEYRFHEKFSGGVGCGTYLFYLPVAIKTENLRKKYS